MGSILSRRTPKSGVAINEGAKRQKDNRPT